MINIRSGVFETNSSSSHSICILGKNAKIDTAEQHIIDMIDEHGMWPIEPEDVSFYRHPFRVLTTPESKIMYAIACASYDDSAITLIEKTVREIEPKFKHFVFMKRYDGQPDRGGTDDRILFPWLKNNNIDLKTFILDSHYFIICDGDEYNIFSDMIAAGIINSDMTKSMHYNEDDMDEYDDYNNDRYRIDEN